jgi:hypothetical protein
VKLKFYILFLGLGLASGFTSLIFNDLFVNSTAQAADGSSENVNTESTGMNTKMLEYLIPGLIAAFASIAAAIIAASNQSKLKKLEEAKAEQDARRDYEYEARKRIYHELEPLIFLHIEDSDRAYNHIKELANMAKLGTLSANLTLSGDLVEDNYYLKATIYKLIRPMAVFSLMQQHLTSYDIQLDDYLRLQYILAKCLYFSCTDDYYVALGSKKKEDYKLCLICRFHGSLKHPEDKEKREHPNHIVYNILGMTQGVTDSLANSLIKFDDNDNTYRVMTFDEFQIKHFDKYVKMTPSMQKICEVISKMNFNNFKNREDFPRYVLLWRILVLHACIYSVMKYLRQKQSQQQDNPNTTHEILNQIGNFIEKEKQAKEFNWVLQSNKFSPEESTKLEEYYNKLSFDDIQKNLEEHYTLSLDAIQKYLEDWLPSNYDNPIKRTKKHKSNFRLPKISFIH